MSRPWRLVAMVALVTLSGCVDSTILLRVAPDGHGQAVITTRLYESGLRAFDAMFPDSPKPSPIENELPEATGPELSGMLGTQVKLVSSRLEKASDGAVRTTVFDFDDITKLSLPFPPMVLSPSGGLSLYGARDSGRITFASARHDNGNRLWLVRLPNQRLESSPDAEITVFTSDSPEERQFKRAIKSMAVRLYVELDDLPLLRTNAPEMKGNRATILSLDLDKLINNLDENKVRRAMAPGTMQEMLWQLGDIPGAVMPVEHEVFLEFEGAQAAQTPPAPAKAAPQAQAPPDTEIYLAPLKTVNGAINVGTPVNISNSAGYDNQPFFTNDGSGVLFTSIRGGGTQTDIYRYDIAARRVSQVTNTPESEYSPTVTPAGGLSVIRVELDGNNTQRLWQFTADGRDPKVVLENVKPVGYHAWADDHTLALFVLGQPATLQLADTRSGAARIIATDIGRSIQPIPGKSSTHEISFVQRERDGDRVRLIVKKLNPSTGETSVLVPAVEGGNEADTAWAPDGTLLMARGGVLYGWRQGQAGWKEVANLERLSLSGVTRLAVSPAGDFLALVGSPRQSR